jgi:hypothetical protein
MRLLTLATAATLAMTPLIAQAGSDNDPITASLQAAMEAYADGDLQYALDELAYVQQLLNAMKAEGLAEYLPAPMGGWTMTRNDEAGAAMGFMGGGTIAQAEYTGPGNSFTVTLMADSPMVTSMGAMLGNSALMASMGTIYRVNRVSFVEQSGDLNGLVANRILVQAENGDIETMIAHLETMDFRDMQNFGQ